MNRIFAGLIATGAVVAAQANGRRWAPTPENPKTAIWYARLRKPSFTPPGPVFAVAWTALDALFGYAGYRLMIAPPTQRRNAALVAWATNLVGIGGFSFFLFGRKRLGEALGVTAGMVATSAAAMTTAAVVDRRAAAASAPLFAWTLFASLLQEEVWRKNA